MGSQLTKILNFVTRKHLSYDMKCC